MHVPTVCSQACIRESCGHMMQAVESAYRPNPYHNSTHAADVVQSLAWLLASDSITRQLTDLELLCMIIAATVHDVGHPGERCGCAGAMFVQQAWAGTKRTACEHAGMLDQCCQQSCRSLPCQPGLPVCTMSIELNTTYRAGVSYEQAPVPRL